MQNCKKCGAEIRYIATGVGASVACDAEKVLFITENGRKTYGYSIHKCKKDSEAKDGKKES